MADNLQVQLPPGYEDAKPVQSAQQDNAVQLPPGYEDAKPFSAATVAPAEPSTWDKVKGIASKVWTGANTPLLPEGRAEKEGRAYADAMPTLAESDNPNWTGVKKGVAGAYADTLNTVRGFTSPLGLATMGLGELGEAPGAIGKLAKVGSRTAGVGFGAQGAEQAAKGGYGLATEGVTPENVRNTLQGTGQALLGGTAALHDTTLGKTNVGMDPNRNIVAGPEQFKTDNLPKTKVQAPISSGITEPVVPTLAEQNLVDNAYTPTSAKGVPAAKPASPLGKAGYVEPTPAPAAKGLVDNSFIPSNKKVAIPEAKAPIAETPEVAAPAHEQAVSTQRALVGEKQKVFDKAKSDMDAYKASVVAGQPVPEKVLSAYDKAQTELTEQQGHLDLAEQHATNVTAGKTSAPNDASVAKPEGLVDNAYVPPSTAKVPEVKAENPLKGVPYPEATPLGKARAGAKPTTELGTARVPEQEISAKDIQVKPTPEQKLESDATQAQYKQAEEAKNSKGSEKTDKYYTGEERRATPRTKPMSATELESALKQRKPIRTPFDETEGAMRTIEGDKNMPKFPGTEEATPKAASFDAKQFSDSHNTDGGHTWNPKYGNPEGQQGLYSVGGGEKLGPTREQLPSDQVTPEQIQKYADRPDVKAAMAKDPNRSIGTYSHDGKTELEVSQIYDNKEKAIAAGKANGEESIRDHGAKDNIPTGGTAGVAPVAEAPKEAPKAAEEPKAEATSSPEDVQRVHNIVKDLGDQEIIKAGGKYDVDHKGYDFSKRTEPTATSKGRARYERENFTADTVKKVPDEMKQKLIKAEGEFDDADSSVFPDRIRNDASRAERAKAIWDKAHEPGYGKETNEGDVADFEGTVNNTIPMGPTPLKELREFTSKHSDEPLKFLSSGGEQSVFELGKDKVLKVGKGKTIKVPDEPEFLQPIEQKDIPAATGEFHASVFDKLDTENIPYSAVKEMNEKLDAKGYTWDYDQKNLGRTADGEYKIIDAGGVTRKGK